MSIKKTVVAVMLVLLSATAWAEEPAIAPEPAPAPIDLRPHFQTGRTARYQVWTARRRLTTASFNGNTRSTETRMEIQREITWAVQNVNPDGSATCLMTLDWMTASITLPDGSVKQNDSRQPRGDIPEMHKLLRAMAGVPLMLNVSADGMVQSVNGTDAIRMAVGDEVPPPDDLDFMESASDLALIAAAPAEAQMNDSWKAQFTWSHEIGKLHHDATYQLVSIEELAGVPVATVTGEAALRLEPQMPEMPEGVPPPTVTLVEGGVKTQIMFDLLRHEAVGRNTVETHTIQVDLNAGEGRSFSTTNSEEIHSQALRIAEQ